mgnify:CR=1 FL=1
MPDSRWVEVILSATLLTVTANESSMDGREDEVAEVARRAALAASEKRRRSRELDGRPTAEDVDQSMMQRMGQALERIESTSDAFSGAMVFRGAAADPLVSLLPEFGSDEAKRTLGRVALGVRTQIEHLLDSPLGPCLDTVLSTERGAVLVNVVADDLLVVSVTGSPPDIGPIWRAMARERAELADAAQRLFTT